jgi:hypothetical protein
MDGSAGRVTVIGPGPSGLYTAQVLRENRTAPSSAEVLVLLTISRSISSSRAQELGNWLRVVELENSKASCTITPLVLDK